MGRARAVCCVGGVLVMAAALAGCGGWGSARAAGPAPVSTSSSPEATVVQAVARVASPGGVDDVRMTRTGFEPQTVFAPTGEVVTIRCGRWCDALHVQDMGRVVLGSARDAAFRFDAPGRYRIRGDEGDVALIVIG